MLFYISVERLYKIEPVQKELPLCSLFGFVEHIAAKGISVIPVLN